MSERKTLNAHGKTRIIARLLILYIDIAHKPKRLLTTLSYLGFYMTY